MSLEARVTDLIVEQLGVSKEEAVANASFIDDLGADSLDIVELVMTLEETFDIEIPDDDAEKMQTINDAVPIPMSRALVWMGARDFLITNPMSRGLIEQFGPSAASVVSCPGGHEPPFSGDPTIETVVAFIRGEDLPAVAECTGNEEALDGGKGDYGDKEWDGTGYEEECYSDDDCSEGRCNAKDVCLSNCKEGEMCPTVCMGWCVKKDEEEDEGEEGECEEHHEYIEELEAHVDELEEEVEEMRMQLRAATCRDELKKKKCQKKSKRQCTKNKGARKKCKATCSEMTGEDLCAL